MGEHTETYMNLYHGTSQIAADEIISRGILCPSQGDSNWCGAGIYFYDNKSKALWAANRKCNELRAAGVRTSPTYINADIIDLERGSILDLRAFKDMQLFVETVEPELESVNLDIDGDISEEDAVILLRSMLISYVARKYGKKLVIGHFLQKKQEKTEDVLAKAIMFNLLVGVETIYCVKDDSIISNIRGAKR